MKIPVRFPPMTPICSSKASPLKASTVIWLRILRAGLRLTGTLLWADRHSLSTGVRKALGSGILCSDPTSWKCCDFPMVRGCSQSLSSVTSRLCFSSQWGFSDWQLTFLRHLDSVKTPAGCPLSGRDLEGDRMLGRQHLRSPAPHLLPMPRLWSQVPPPAWLSPLLWLLLCAF